MLRFIRGMCEMDEFKFDDFELLNYVSEPVISAPVAV